jgi:hypothetical protein
MTADAVTQDGRAPILADGNRMPLLGPGIPHQPTHTARSVHQVRGQFTCVRR